MRILVTGGAGFIGSCFVRLLISERDEVEVLNLDKLTYAGNLENRGVVRSSPRYRFVLGDICDAELVDRTGRDGEIYNIGGNRSLPNLEVVGKILAAAQKPSSLIQYVTDRPGHDRRYALSSEKLISETGWRPLKSFEQGLAETVEWYRSNPEWVTNVRSGEYQRYYARNYQNRSEMVAVGV